MPFLIVQPRHRQNRRFVAKSKQLRESRASLRIGRRKSIQVASVVDNPNFVLWHPLVSDQMPLRRVRHRDIFVDQPSDLPIHPEAGAQSFPHPPDLGTVTGLEHRADPSHPRNAGAEQTGGEQMAMQNRDILAPDEIATAARRSARRSATKIQAAGILRPPPKVPVPSPRSAQLGAARHGSNPYSRIAVKIDSACSSAPPNIRPVSRCNTARDRALGPTNSAEAFACHLRHR